MAKIVKAESRNKSKTPFSDLVMPRRILFKTKSKIVKAESRDKSKTPFSDLVMPRRILFKTKSKTVKAESRGKSRTKNYDMVALGANIDAANHLGEDIFGFRCRR